MTRIMKKKRRKKVANEKPSKLASMREKTEEKGRERSKREKRKRDSGFQSAYSFSCLGLQPPEVQVVLRANIDKEDRMLSRKISSK